MLNRTLTLVSVGTLAVALAGCGSGDSTAPSAVAGVSETVNDAPGQPDGGNAGNDTPETNGGGSDGDTDGDTDTTPGDDSAQVPDTDTDTDSNNDNGGDADTDTDSDGNDDQSSATPAVASYELTFTNLTAGQPLSPPLAIAHQAGYRLLTLGKPASVALEELAEGAATDALAAQAMATGIVWSTAVNPGGPIGPGQHATMTIDLHAGADPASAYLSAAAMLVNTNDAITAVMSAPIHTLAPGQTWQTTLGSYDTGTEANTEQAGTIPGPADGGEGFNPVRDDDIDAVLAHPGAITADDGLAGSVLRDIHRWQNPVVRLTIQRVY